MSAVPTPRVQSIDAFRGFVMLAMCASGLALPAIAGKLGDQASPGLLFLAYEFDHVKWGGCAFWDLIQPSFMFLVGVSMPFSYGLRRDRGDPAWRRGLHALVRAVVLTALGVLLYSGGCSATKWDFRNVLAQIGLGYFFLWAIWELGNLATWAAILALLGGTWWAFHAAPLPTPEDVAALRAEAGEGASFVKADFHRYDGYAARWNNHFHPFATADRRLLNALPRPAEKDGKPLGRWVADEYFTGNFLPALATMLLGTLAGGLMRSACCAGWRKFWALLASGVALLALGLALDHTLWPTGFPQAGAAQPAIDAGPDHPFASPQWTVCPAIKKLWTPTWAVFSAGWAFVLLAWFHGVVDLCGARWLGFPFMVVGANSIACYLLHNTFFHGFAKGAIARHFGVPSWLGAYEPLGLQVAYLFVLWLVLYWMHRQKAFLRI